MTDDPLVRILVQNSRDGLYIIDRETRRFIFVSPSLLEMLGYETDEMLGARSQYIDLVASESRPLVEEREAELARGEEPPPNYEFMALRKDGSSIPVEAHVRYIRDKQRNLVIGIVRDISERKEFERRLEESRSAAVMEQERLASVLAALEDPLYVVDSSLTIHQVNAAVVKHLGQDPTTARCYAVFRSRGEACDGCPAIRAMRTGTKHQATYTDVDRDGVEHIYELSAFPIGAAGSASDGSVVVMRDVTDRLRREEERNYLRSVVHQLVAPMAAIEWHCKNIAAGEYPESRVPRILKTLEMLCKLTMSQTRNGAFLNELARATPERIRKLKEDIPIRELLIGIASDFQGIALAKNIRVHVDEGSFSDFPRLRGVRRLLEHVFINLIDNAVKYSAEATKIRVFGFVGGRNYHICVENYGLPLRGDEVEQVFLPRFRTRDAELAQPTGTGLGLWIAREIMSLHGGKVIAEPTDGAGKTVFRVISPRQEE